MSNNNKEKKKIIVIGGGLGGLSTAAILAKDGHDVKLYEKTLSLGGRAICKKVGDYLLDWGIHACRGAEKGAANRVLQKVGKKIDFAIKNSDGNIPQYYYNGKIADLPNSFIKVLGYPLLSLSGKIQFLKLLKIALKTKPDTLGEKSVAQWLQENSIKNIDLVNHIKAFVGIGYYCYPEIEKILASEFVRFIQNARYNAGYPIGGWKQIIDKLVHSIEEHNGKIVLGKRIDKILVEDKKIIGIEIDNNGQFMKADAIVLGIPMRDISKLIIKDIKTKETIPWSLLPSLPNSFTSEQLETSSAIVIDLAFKEQQIFSKKKDTIVVVDPLVILRNSTKHDKTLAPEGQHLLSAWMPIPQQKLKDKEYVNNAFIQMEKIIDKVFPGLISKAIFKRKLLLKAVIGFYPKKGMGIESRPDVKYSEFSNLYLVGDGINSPSIGGSSDAAFTSAVSCSNLINEQICGIDLA
jgi:phytoene dehydrogenase-like protein